MGFESTTNSITAFLQDVADNNSYTIRYDNDSRATPTDTLWLESKINFGNSDQIELGINLYRNFGTLIVTIRNSIGLGIGELLENADIIVAAFRTMEIGDIIFRVPNILNKGRVGDNWEVEITCPFSIDEN